MYYESLACSTPILTTDGTDTWAELQSSGAAEIIPLGHDLSADPAAIARAAERMLADPAALERRGEFDREWVFEHVCPGRVADRFENVYCQAIGPSPRLTARV